MEYILISAPFVLLAIGAVLLIFPKGSSARRLGEYLAIIGGVVSLLMTYWLLTYPSAERQAAQERLLFCTNTNEIRSVAIDPRYEDTAHLKYNLVRSPITLRDAKQIGQVIQALRQAEPFRPNHPGKEWSCLLTITSNDDSVCVEVMDTKSQENGVIVYLKTQRTQGWVVAEYRCDPLGAVLERVVNEVGANPK